MKKKKENKQNEVQELKRAEEKAIELLEQTLEAINELAQVRLKCKLSNSRVAGVYRELKELLKVMSVYNENGNQ